MFGTLYTYCAETVLTLNTKKVKPGLNNKQY